MNGRECWDFLDEWNPNLLYQYAKKYDVTNETYQLAGNANETYYLIWFVFRYVLGCETYEDALKHSDIENFKKYGITDALILRDYEKIKEKKDVVFSIGSEEFGKIVIKIPKSSFYRNDNYVRIRNTIEFLLDIIYHRYNYLEQIDCYIKHFSKSGVYPAKQPVAVVTAKKILKNSVEELKKRSVFSEVLALHQSTRKDILGEFYYEL